MKLESVESIIRWLGGALAYVTLGIVLYGVWRGTRRPSGRTTGLNVAWQRSAWFYFASAVVFFGIGYLGWRRMLLAAPPSLRVWMLAVGSLLYFPGMSLALWGRLALGKNYFVSSGFGAQLFAGHQLVSGGPFALVRHPMYTGLILVALGALLMYTTWTTLAFACFAPLLILRARREEHALAAEFGKQWWEYCRRVPAFIPRLGKRGE